MSYQTTNIYKPSDAKIRRVKTPPQQQFSSYTQDMMKPDSHGKSRNSVDYGF